MRITDAAVPDVPDVPELVAVSHEVFYAPTREWRKTVEPEYYRKNGDLVRDLIDKSKAAAMLAAKDEEIERIRSLPMGQTIVQLKQRAEAAEAELAQIKAQEPYGYIDGPHFSTEPIEGWIPIFSPPVDQTAEIERLRVIALSLCDHMEIISADLFDKTKSQQNPNISSMRIAIDEARAALSEKEPS